MRIQREELEETRIELKRTAEAQEESSQALGRQLKEMQKQTEIQLRPFVVIKFGKPPGYTMDQFMAVNVGNSTAINIVIYNETNSNYISEFNSSTLEKSHAVSLGLPSDSDNIDGHQLVITFQNINKEDYHVKETVGWERHEVTEFEKGKYELPEPSTL